MRIALVGPAHPYKGGGARHTTELALRLSAAGHDTVIESWRAQYPSALYPGEQTIAVPEGALFPATRHELAWYRPDGWWRAGRRLARGADLVVLSLFSPVQVVPYLGLLGGVTSSASREAPVMGWGRGGSFRSREAPAVGWRRGGSFRSREAPIMGWRRGDGRAGRTVALCHNVLPHERTAVDIALTRSLLRRVDTILTHSPEQRHLARGLAGPAARVRMAELPPHLPEARAAAPVGSRDDAEPPARNHLLFLGMVRHYKGVDLLLRALAAGPSQVSLTVAGEFWGGSAELRRLAAELGVADRVEFREGYVPAAEVPELFARADALVLPYRSATATQNVWWAFEHGRPVIATRAGSLGRQVRDGVDGVLCAPDDVADLTAALRRFYAPGTPRSLRAGVRPVDPEPYWSRYLATLVDGSA